MPDIYHNGEYKYSLYMTLFAELLFTNENTISTCYLLICQVHRCPHNWSCILRLGGNDGSSSGGGLNRYWSSDPLLMFFTWQRCDGHLTGLAGGCSSSVYVVSSQEAIEGGQQQQLCDGPRAR